MHHLHFLDVSWQESCELCSPAQAAQFLTLFTLGILRKQICRSERLESQNQTWPAVALSLRVLFQMWHPLSEAIQVTHLVDFH